MSELRLQVPFVFMINTGLIGRQKRLRQGQVDEQFTARQVSSCVRQLLSEDDGQSDPGPDHVQVGQATQRWGFCGPSSSPTFFRVIIEVTCVTTWQSCFQASSGRQWAKSASYSSTTWTCRPGRCTAHSPPSSSCVSTSTTGTGAFRVLRVATLLSRLVAINTAKKYEKHVCENCWFRLVDAPERWDLFLLI